MQKTYKGFLPIFILLFVSFTGLYLVFINLHFPYIGITFQKNPVGQWVVNSVDRMGWASMEDVRVGDILLSVNDHPPSSFSAINRYNIIEQAHSFHLQHLNPEGVWETNVYNLNSELSLTGQVIYHTAFPVTIFLVYLVFSGFLYMKKKDDPAALLLILFFLAIGISYLSSGAASRNDSYARVVVVTALPLVPIFFMQFMNEYMKIFKLQFVRSWILISLYTGAALMCGLELLMVMTDIGLSIDSAIISGFSLFFFSLVIFMDIYQLISLYSKHQRTVLRPVFKLILTGQAAAFLPFVIFTAIPRVLFNLQILPAEWSTLCLVFLPVVYIYLITAEQFFDIDFVIDRFRYYSIIAFLPAGIVTVLIAAVMNSAYDFWSKWLQAFLVVYLGIMVFLYCKEVLDFRFSPKLFKVKMNFQASLDRFSKNISHVMTSSDLEIILMKELKETLFVKTLALIEFSKETGRSDVLKYERTKPDSALLGQLTHSFSGLSAGDLMETTGGMWLCIGGKKKLTYLLWMDRRENRTRFNPDERMYLKTLANYTGIVYENLFLIEGLIDDLEREMQREQKTSPWLLRLLFNLSENERRKLGSDLHDSALQEQLLWYRRLESVILDEKLPQPLQEELRAIKEGLLDVIHEIRETCNELRPPLLKELGIVGSLEHLFESTQLRTNFIVEFESTPITQPLNDEMILAIYRIVQELLRNASKHSKASKVWIELLETDRIRFHYKDNGIGMQLDQWKNSFKHMGLSGVRERVISLEGEVTFHSVPGEGFEAWITLPLETSLNAIDKGNKHDSYLIG